MDHPVSADALSAQVAKVCGPKTPAGLKAMAADGLAPLVPVDLASALYILAYDDNEKIRTKATSTLSNMPENVLFGALEQISNQYVLDGLSTLLSTRNEAIKKILLNQSTADTTVEVIAKTNRDEMTLEMVAANEERMLRYPGIIEVLYHNKAARMSTVDRAVELAIRNDVELTGIGCFEQLKAALAGELIPEATEEPTPDDLLFKQVSEDEEIENLDEKTVDEALENTDAPEKDVKAVKNLQQSLSNMTISGKIRRATLGNSAERAVLIRDANKLVVMAVVRSPGVRDSEVMQFVKYRSLPEEAVRFMASNREWTKHYQVKLSLVQNPRCPMEFALRFLPHLRANDVRALERDKNVPQAITKAAKQLRAKRMR